MEAELSWQDVADDKVKTSKNLVRFYMRSVLDVKATEGWVEWTKNHATGEMVQTIHPPSPTGPVHVTKEYVRIMVPADRTLEVDREVTDKDRRAYREQYTAFKQEADQDYATGTPLSALGLPPDRIDDYAYARIRTIQQLANVTDGNVSNMGPGALTERQRARDFVTAAEGRAPLVALRTENEAMKAQLETMQKQLTALVEARAPSPEAIQAVEEAKPKRTRRAE